MAIDSGAFIKAVRSVAGHDEVIPLHAPSIGELERRYVNECLESTFVSSVGVFVDRFESEVAAFTGASAAVAVSNGTVALQVALLMAGVCEGDEVIVPALSFIATANAVSNIGAHPYFVDSEFENLGMSPDSVADTLAAANRSGDKLFNPSTGRRIAAIVPMHTLGHPARIADLLEVAEAFGVPVVEDAAESLGSLVGAKHTGTFGLLGTLSFNGNKIITTGGGGMIITNDLDLARRAKHLTTTAKLPHRWEFEHDQVGFNFRMPNLNAALGVAQAERLPELLDKKREIARLYAEAFADVEGIEFIAEPPGTSSNYWLCAVRLDGGAAERDEALSAATRAGLQCRPLWNLLSDQAPYRHAPRSSLSVATRLQSGVVCLPSSASLAV